MRILSLLFVSLVLLGGCSAAEEDQNVRRWRFVEETVRIDVVDGWFTVEADYVFTSKRDSESLVLLLPFPKDENLGPPQLINARITTGGATRPLTVLMSTDGWRFELGDSGTSRHVVHLSYGQDLNGGRAVYILSSVQEWGKPLEKALLEVRIPDGRECRISPTLPAVGSEEGKQVFRKTFEDWYPEQDLVVELWLSN